MENKNVEFFGENSVLRYDVTKWRHNINILINLESTHQGLSYEVLHDMILWIPKFDFKVRKFWPAARPMKVKTIRPQKLIRWVADHMLLSHQLWSWSDNSH
jgi:hypothetical protein